MATAVLDLNINQLPSTIDGLEHYQQALILIRFGLRPVGQVRIPVVDGQIRGSEIHAAVLATCSEKVYKQWLYTYLGWDEVAPVATLPMATVAVCTRDRPTDLRRCLHALMQIPDEVQEILVVDSCSAETTTRQVVEEFPQVRYVREDRPGLNIARNRAMQEARHEIVAFCDDDAMPDPGWFRGLLRNFSDPLVLCATGLTMPVELETEAQELFEQYSPFNRGFQRRVFDSRALNPALAGHVGAGANMALRKSAIEKVGPFDDKLDAGTPTHSGGDNEIFSRIIAAGYKIVYDPAALSWHRHRRTVEELQQTFYGYGLGVYAAWTRNLLVEREFGVFLAAISWFVLAQFPNLLRSLLHRPNSTPLSLVWAELRGCINGPLAYLTSQKSA
jgi:GT2 family glycosyltransferase